MKLYSRKLKTWKNNTQKLVSVVTTQIPDIVFTCWKSCMIFHYASWLTQQIKPKLAQVCYFMYGWSHTNEHCLRQFCQLYQCCFIPLNNVKNNSVLWSRDFYFELTIWQATQLSVTLSETTALAITLGMQGFKKADGAENGHQAEAIVSKKANSCSYFSINSKAYNNGQGHGQS